jgi:hypothetical protein
MYQRVTTLENQRGTPAHVFHPLLNSQLAVVPPAGAGFARHLSHGSHAIIYHRTPCADLEAFARDFPLCSLSDLRHSRSAANPWTAGEPPAASFESPISLQIVRSDTGGGGDGIMYSLVEQHAEHGNVATLSRFVLAYDNMCYRSNAAAAAALQTLSRGERVDAARHCGAWRIVDPADGALGEYVEMWRADITPARGAKAHTNTPVVCFRGRIYITRSLYDAIRRALAPTMHDRIVEGVERVLKISSNASSESFGRHDWHSSVDADGVHAAAPVTAPVRASQVAKSSAEAARAAANQMRAPDQTLIGPRYWGGGGFGAGVGLGLGAGLGFGVAAGAYGYPRYYGPYAPGYYGYPYYGYRPYYPPPGPLVLARITNANIAPAGASAAAKAGGK